MRVVSETDGKRDMEDGAFPQSHCVCQQPSTRSSLLVELIRRTDSDGSSWLSSVFLVFLVFSSASRHHVEMAARMDGRMTCFPTAKTTLLTTIPILYLEIPSIHPSSSGAPATKQRQGGVNGPILSGYALAQACCITRPASSITSMPLLITRGLNPSGSTTCSGTHSDLQLN